MSKIYFHTRTRTSGLRGSERGWLRHIADNAAEAWWGLNGTNNLDTAVEIANMIVDGSSGQYVRDWAYIIGLIPDRGRTLAVQHGLGTRISH